MVWNWLCIHHTEEINWIYTEVSRLQLLAYACPIYTVVVFVKEISCQPMQGNMNDNASFLITRWQFQRPIKSHTSKSPQSGVGVNSLRPSGA